MTLDQAFTEISNRIKSGHIDYNKDDFPVGIAIFQSGRYGIHFSRSTSKVCEGDINDVAQRLEGWLRFTA